MTKPMDHLAATMARPPVPADVIAGLLPLRKRLLAHLHARADVIALELVRAGTVTEVVNRVKGYGEYADHKELLDPEYHLLLVLISVVEKYAALSGTDWWYVSHTLPDDYRGMLVAAVQRRINEKVLASFSDELLP
jgi:hypothetical protein